MEMCAWVCMYTPVCLCIHRRVYVGTLFYVHLNICLFLCMYMCHVYVCMYKLQKHINQYIVNLYIMAMYNTIKIMLVSNCAE